LSESPAEEKRLIEYQQSIELAELQFHERGLAIVRKSTSALTSLSNTSGYQLRTKRTKILQLQPVGDT
jgi:hypothetical protein